MALVSFTLSEEGVGAFNDALVCIHKFSDDVSLEVKKDKVRHIVKLTIETLLYVEATRLLTSGLHLAGSHCTQPHQVCLRLLHLRREQVLLTFLIRGQRPPTREILLYHLHQGKRGPVHRVELMS